MTEFVGDGNKYGLMHCVDKVVKYYNLVENDDFRITFKNKIGERGTSADKAHIRVMNPKDIVEFGLACPKVVFKGFAYLQSSFDEPSYHIKVEDGKSQLFNVTN